MQTISLQSLSDNNRRWYGTLAMLYQIMKVILLINRHLILRAIPNHMRLMMTNHRDFLGMAWLQRSPWKLKANNFPMLFPKINMWLVILDHLQWHIYPLHWIHLRLCDPWVYSIWNHMRTFIVKIYRYTLGHTYKPKNPSSMNIMTTQNLNSTNDGEKIIMLINHLVNLNLYGFTK